MGCWEETCALTNTPIYAGEPCVMVRFTPSVFEYEPERTPFGGMFDWGKVIGIHKGMYNNYGGLHRVMDRNPNEVTVFFHEAAWNLCQSQNAGKVYGVDELARTVPHAQELNNVREVAMITRRDLLAGRLFSGHQEWDALRWQQALHTLTGTILDALQQQETAAQEDKDE